MMRKESFWFIGMILIFILIDAGAQSDPPVTRAEMKKVYESNILKSRIDGVYIPKDIEDAYEEFIHLSPEESIEQFKLVEEKEAARKLHFGIGRWMIKNWNFYEGSRLSHYLRGKGLLHPDDMADCLIRVFHRKLNGKPDDLDQLVQEYDAIRAEQRKKMGSIHFEKEPDK